MKGDMENMQGQNNIYIKEADEKLWVILLAGQWHLERQIASAALDHYLSLLTPLFVSLAHCHFFAPCVCICVLCMCVFTYTASVGGNVDVGRVLVDAGADVNVVDQVGKSVLMVGRRSHWATSGACY